MFLKQITNFFTSSRNHVRLNKLFKSKNSIDTTQMQCRYHLSKHFKKFELLKYNACDPMKNFLISILN